MHTLRFVHPLQNELQQLLMCFTSSHLFLCFIEILSKNGPPFFVHSQKSTDHRTKFRHKNQRWNLSGVWLCGAPQHCGWMPIISSCPKWGFLLEMMILLICWKCLLEMMILLEMKVFNFVKLDLFVFFPKKEHLS